MPARHVQPGRRWFLAYVVGLHLLVGFLVFKTDFIPKVKARLLTDAMAPNPHGQRMIAYHQAMDASVPDGAAIFLGDSITQGLAVAAVSAYPINYGISGATTSELLANLPKYQSLKRASAVFLMIGVNDIGQGKFEGLGDRLRAIAAGIPTGPSLVWSGIMPAYSEGIDPRQITAANTLVKQLCAARAGCTYIDTQALFSAGGTGLFHDGVHPNDQGYATWIAALRKARQAAGGAR